MDYEKTKDYEIFFREWKKLMDFVNDTEYQEHDIEKDELLQTCQDVCTI